MDYNTIIEQVFYIVISEDVCSGWYGRRYCGNDHYISRYGSDGYGKGVENATRLERFISLYSPEINFFHGGENSCMRSQFIANYVGRAYMKLIRPQVIRIQKYYRVLPRRVHIAITRIQEQYHFTIILKRCFLQGLKTASSIFNCWDSLLQLNIKARMGMRASLVKRTWGACKQYQERSLEKFT